MALKFKKHKEIKPYFEGRELLRELRSQNLSRDEFARRMEEITGTTWYPSKVKRLEQKSVNYVDKEMIKALRKALP